MIVSAIWDSGSGSYSALLTPDKAEARVVSTTERVLLEVTCIATPTLAMRGRLVSYPVGIYVYDDCKWSQDDGYSPTTQDKPKLSTSIDMSVPNYFLRAESRREISTRATGKMFGLHFPMLESGDFEEIRVSAKLVDPLLAPAPPMSVWSCSGGKLMDVGGSSLNRYVQEHPERVMSWQARCVICGGENPALETLRQKQREADRELNAFAQQRRLVADPPRRSRIGDIVEYANETILPSLTERIFGTAKFSGGKEIRSPLTYGRAEPEPPKKPALEEFTDPEPPKRRIRFRKDG